MGEGGETGGVPRPSGKSGGEDPHQTHTSPSPMKAWLSQQLEHEFKVFRGFSSTGRRTAAGVMSSSGLVTWGRATHGQLGHGRKQRNDLPQPTVVSQMQGRPIQGVACGHFHSAAVVEGSPAEVHTWGRGALGLLGHGDEEDSYQPRPVRALAGISIRQVACGAYQTAAVAESGALYCWGWRLEKVRGGGVIEGYSTLPDQVHALDGVQVRSVACGHYCTAACTTDGSLYTWGKGERGQLGHGHPADVVEPQRVGGGALASNPFVWDAQFGKHFLLVLVASGDLCSCGAADGGVLGGGTAGGALMLSGPTSSRGGGGSGGMMAYSIADEHTLRPIAALQGARVCAIACGESHCAAISGEGEVYTWGAAAYGKLGHSGVDDVPTPTVVALLRGKRFVEVACGAHTTLALTDGGHVYSWGAHAVAPPPPTRVRLGGSACTIGCGGGHQAVALGEYPVTVSADLALARQVGFEPPVTRASIPPSVASELGPMLSSVVEARVAPDADPATVLRELHELRGLLAFEEARRDAANSELMQLQQQLQQVLVDEEMLRERRGGAEPPAEPQLAKGVAVVDSSTYQSMLPDERLELSLFGFKVALATTTSKLS